MLLNSVLFLFLVQVSWALVSVPINCHMNFNTPCLLKTQNEYFSFSKEGVQYSLKKNTQIFVDKDKVSLVSGDLLISVGEGKKLHLQTTEINLNVDHGVCIIEKNDNLTRVKNLNSSQVLVLTKANKVVQTVSSLFENWYNGYDSKGQLVSGVLSVLDKENTILNILSFPSQSKEPIQEVIDFINEQHSVVVEKSSELAQEQVQRQIANERSQEKKKKQDQSQDDYLRQLYRKKNYLE